MQQPCLQNTQTFSEWKFCSGGEWVKFSVVVIGGTFSDEWGQRWHQRFGAWSYLASKVPWKKHRYIGGYWKQPSLLMTNVCQEIDQQRAKRTLNFICEGGENYKTGWATIKNFRIAEYRFKVWGVGWAPAGLVGGRGGRRISSCPKPPQPEPEMSSLWEILWRVCPCQWPILEGVFVRPMWLTHRPRPCSKSNQISILKMDLDFFGHLGDRIGDEYVSSFGREAGLSWAKSMAPHVFWRGQS